MEEPRHSDIYMLVGDMKGRLNAVEKLVSDGFERLEETISKGFGGVKEVTDKHEDRIRNLEIAQGAVKGGLKTIIWVGGAMGTVTGIGISLAQWVLG